MSCITLPCLTFHDPWACCAAGGVKTLETRRGAVLSGFTGPLVIHRSRAAPDDDYLIAMGWPPSPRPPWAQPEDDLAGLCLGVVWVARTWRYRDVGDDGTTALFRLAGVDERCETHNRLRDEARYHDITGRYLSRLTRAAWLTRPIPARGMQGRWKVDLPDDCLPAWAVTPA